MPGFGRTYGKKKPAAKVKAKRKTGSKKKPAAKSARAKKTKY